MKILKMNFSSRLFLGLFYFFALSIFLISCEYSEDDQVEDVKLQTINDLKLINGVLHLNSKESLQNIMNEYKEGGDKETAFIEKIKSFQSNGFRPLEVSFYEDDSSMLESFVKRKKERIEKLNIDYGFSAQSMRQDDDIDLDDEIIFDPAFASLLNEDREIVIDEKFYKYTEMGLFKSDLDKEIVLKNYINDLTPEQRISIINNGQQSLPCGTQTLIFSIAPDVELFQPDSNPQPCNGGWSSGNTNPIQNPVSPTFAPLSDLIKQGFPACQVQQESIWQQIFGASEGCIQYMNDNKRVKTKFWNQNYFVYASIGCKVKFQKHIQRWYGSWWEKSYADNLELGVNYLTYEYNFNVPVFNQAQYNNETTFFEFNGTKFNVNGQIINSVPTGIGNFIFDTESAGSIMNITILGYHLTNQNINQVIDLAVMQAVNGLQDVVVKNEIISKISTGSMKYNVINAVPFSNKVKIITSDVRWSRSNENAITHYFDFNFLFTWKNSFSGFGDYLQGLTGSTDYTNISADIYGAAYHNSQWGGSRLTYNRDF